jgi:hypothetical protein
LYVECCDGTLVENELECPPEGTLDVCGVCGGNNNSCTGCTDPYACNYVIGNTIDDGSCNYDCVGCTNSFACNHDPNATQPCGGNNNCCEVPDCNGDCGGNAEFDDCNVCGGNNGCLGCTDSEAINYYCNNNDCEGQFNDIIPPSIIDDGSCYYNLSDISGCTNPAANNYNSNATVDDGSCECINEIVTLAEEEYSKPILAEICNCNISQGTGGFSEDWCFDDIGSSARVCYIVFGVIVSIVNVQSI